MEKSKIYLIIALFALLVSVWLYFYNTGYWISSLLVCVYFMLKNTTYGK